MMGEETRRVQSLAQTLGRAPDEEYDDGQGRIEFWLEHGRVALFAAHGYLSGASVEWATARLSAVVARNAPRRICVAWDLSGQEHHETDARRLSARWFREHRRSVTRFVLYLPPRPFIRMAATVALAAVGASEHVYSAHDRFLSVVRETVDYVARNG